MQQRVDFDAFRELLQSLENAEVRIRCRALGESWIPFSQLILLSDSAMILQIPDDRKVILNVRSVIEFELEKQVGEVRPGAVYQIAY